jgi:peptidoglycan/LPS O-acetylase OafA/YrhL
VCLDGVRGLMTLMVLFAHYFGEVPHGISAFMFGWIAVDMFFVLSGYLVGKLILEKQQNDNFFQIFYVRRVCRTLPIYFVCLIINIVLLSIFTAPWVDADQPLPIWSYFTFTQNFFMAATNGIGAHWLAPTWTLAIEEHFYLIVPFLFFLIPRRRIAAVLIAITASALILRAGSYLFMEDPGFISLVLLPTRADILTSGLLAAVVIKSETVPWQRVDYPLRLAPIILLLTVSVLRLTDGASGHRFEIFGPLLISCACAAFLLSLVRGAPEAKRFHSKFLGFFNTTSYAVYLTHLPVLGLMHGLLLGTRPDIASPAQLAVTIAALPVCIAVAWLLTVFIEQPVTNYGRTWTWSGRPRRPRAGELNATVSVQSPGRSLATVSSGPQLSQPDNASPARAA